MTAAVLPWTVTWSRCDRVRQRYRADSNVKVYACPTVVAKLCDSTPSGAFCPPLNATAFTPSVAV